mgnify:CR=1 FL=1
MLVFLGLWEKVRFAILGSGVLEGLNIFFFMCFIPSSSLVYAPSPDFENFYGNQFHEGDVLGRLRSSMPLDAAVCHTARL